MFPVGLAIAVYRKQEGITAENLAKDLGVARAFLTLIESGNRLPPLKNEFIEAAAEFLNVPKMSVFTSIMCEHTFASMKGFVWFSPLICKAISMGFTEYYLKKGLLIQEKEKVNENDVSVLSPADHFRAPLLQDLLSRLHLVAGDFNYLDKEAIIEAQKFKVIGVFKNAKPYLYQSESLFPLRDTLVFLDSFGVHDDLFYFEFQAPITEQPSGLFYKHVDIKISPYESAPIDIVLMPPRIVADDLDKTLDSLAKGKSR